MATPSAKHEVVGVTLALDAVAVEVCSGLEEAGISSLLLKGPAIGRWLYDSPGERVYDDIDLLVRESDLGRAEAKLREHGFRFVHDDWHGRVWQRGPVSIDLHRRLAGAGADSGLVFDTLLAGSEWLELGRGRVRIPAAPARALHLGLHAAQHGPDHEGPLEDLRRGLTRISESTWQEAAVLTDTFESGHAFSAGLGLLPEGEELRLRLGLEGQSREPEPPVTAGLLRLSATPGARAKATLLTKELFPTRAYLRAHVPLARRGRSGLWLARAWRPIWLLLRLGPALIAARRSGRDRPF
jgi:Uncharacterised nucleotidyltransferase